MMKNLFAIVIIFLFAQAVLAQQVISGKVVDAETGEPVPFVNIGIKELGIGTVSNSQGAFELKYKTGEHIVLFSSIGYEVKNIPLSQVVENPNVKLVPKTEILNEVVINADKYGSQVVLGNKLDNKGHSIGFGSRFLGTEIGAHIKVKRKTFIQSAHFTINFTGADSLLFRVNLYQFKQGVVGEKLIRENIIITARQEKGTFDIDLSDYNIVISKDVLLSLEWIQDDNGVGNEGLMFRSKRVMSGGNLYTKRTSHSDFLRLSDEISAAPAINIGFYLKGIQE